MFDQLTNEGMLDKMLYDWYTYRNSHYMWKNKIELWRRWLRV